MSTTISVHTFSNRKDLEAAVIAGAALCIEGTTDELQSLHLRHGQKVHGAVVIATDYVNEKRKQNTAFRGVSTVSKINGQVINTKIKKSK